MGCVQTAENTYFPAWRDLVLRNAFLVALVAIPLVVLESSAAGLIRLACLTPVVLLWLRYLDRVRISASGLRGSGRQITKWSEVTEVESAGLNGLVVRSTFVPSVPVARSIARDPDFRRQVLNCANAG